MSRKRDPNAVVDDFRRLLKKSLQTFRAVYKSVDWDDSLSKELSINAFLRAAVGWEGFRSDWHVAAINRDASVFSVALRAEAQERHGGAPRYARTTQSLAASLPKHPTLEQIRELVDPSDRNVDFAGGWVQRARRELAAPYVARVEALTKEDRALITAVAAIRNCIAHGSPSSVAAMNSALAQAPDPLRGPKHTIHNSGLGRYLWETPPGTKTNAARVEIYHRRLRFIAVKLRVRTQSPRGR